MLLHLSTMITTPVSSGATTWQQKATATSRIVRTPLANGLQMAPLLSNTSLANAMLLIYSQKKWKMGPNSAAFAICSCVAWVITSKVHTILHALLPHLILQSLHNPLVMCNLWIKGILDVLLSFPSLHLPSMLSSISSTGRHILSPLAPFSYMQVLLSNPMGGGST